jgi:hypothetical protein
MYESDEEPFERQTEERGQLIPPSRRPPTAIGAGTFSPAPSPRRRPARSTRRVRFELPLGIGSVFKSVLRAGFDLGDAVAAFLLHGA